MGIALPYRSPIPVFRNTTPEQLIHQGFVLIKGESVSLDLQNAER